MDDRRQFARKPAGKRQDGMTTGQQRVLILSGHAAAGRQLSLLIRQHAWSVTIVNGVDQALQAMQGGFNALIADVEEAGLQGLNLLAHCRRDFPHKSIFAICNGGGSPAMRRARAIGVDGFFYLRPGGDEIDTLYGMAALLARWPMPSTGLKGQTGRPARYI